MKQKVFSFFIVGLLLVSFAIPAYAATSSYSFTMSFRVVDGSANKEFHKLDKGSVSISGSHRVSSSGDGARDTPLQLNYQLCNKTSGNCFGTVKATPRADGTRTYVNGTYSGLGGGTNYYLFIYRNGTDGHTISGSGTLSNK